LISVTEYIAGDASRPITELTDYSGLTVLSQNNVIIATQITLPGFDLERYEGMLVSFTSVLTVGQNYFQGRYGQVTLSGGRMEKPTNHYRAGTAEAIAAAAANAAAFVVLDDGTASQNPDPIPYIFLYNTTRAGDTVTSLTGVIDFGLITSSSSGPTGYKVQPTEAPVFVRR
jgi:predicted extracellular nuclease